MEDTIKDKYITNNIEEASFLLVMGSKLLGLERDATSFYSFIFENKNQCTDLKRQYASGAEVQAMALFDKRRFLLGEVNQAKRQVK